MRSAAILIAALALTACAGSKPSVSSSARQATTPGPAQTSPQTGFRAPQVMQQRGLDGVIGAQAGALLRRFGTARIDLSEGDARKLQFSGNACILDIYLYPLRSGAEPVATHVEARLRQGGKETDRTSCIREVEKQR